MNDKPSAGPAKSQGKRRSPKSVIQDLFACFNPKDHALITIDPDPDAIASALALKRLLWHKVQSTTIGMIRPIRRLNNVTMVRLMKLPLTLLSDLSLNHFNKFLLVDAQPHHNEKFLQFTYSVVIDHHPLSVFLDAPFVEIHPDYGATSTILTQYLRAARIKPSRDLATTLLYGIKTDTRSFERKTLDEDIEAFRYLFGLANHNILRKIEISDLSLKDLKFFYKAVERKHVVRDRIFAHLDEVPSADVLVEIADFFLKIHDISWSMISGIYEGHLIIIVRNDGYRKDAGRTVRRAFGSIGCAGGHHAMARAEIPMEKVSKAVGKLTSKGIEQFIRRQLSPFS